jgi:hypothetical protein
MSNIKYTHKVNSHAEAEALCSEKGGDVRLGYNTMLGRVGDDYVVIHHTTPIITFHLDGSATLDAAYVSRTTANRLHYFKPETVERVNSHISRRAQCYTVTLKDHPGVFDIDLGEKYRIYPDRTVVKV